VKEPAPQMFKERAPFRRPLRVEDPGWRVRPPIRQGVSPWSSGLVAP
jgi:hypothetical protein